MLLRTRAGDLGFATGVNTREIARTSRMVSRLTGYPVQPNKAIVGRNAFAHESGIHQDGVLKDRSTYEIMDATTIGLEGNDLVLGKHSGRHALKSALQELGFEVDGQALNTAFKRFKEIADRKKHVTAMDLEALVTDELRDELRSYTLKWFDVDVSNRRPPHARVAVRTPDGEEVLGDFTGDGPVDAIFRAINAATRREARLREFRIDAVTGGPGRARRGERRARARGPVRRRPGRLDRHHRGGRAGLRARALQRGAQGARAASSSRSCPRPSSRRRRRPRAQLRADRDQGDRRADAAPAGSAARRARRRPSAAAITRRHVGVGRRRPAAACCAPATCRGGTPRASRRRAGSTRRRPTWPRRASHAAGASCAERRARGRAAAAPPASSCRQPVTSGSRGSAAGAPSRPSRAPTAPRSSSAAATASGEPPIAADGALSTTSAMPTKPSISRSTLARSIGMPAKRDEHAPPRACCS